MKRVTQADIAKAVNLSPATVALVVGQSRSRLRHCVRKETADRIREKAREMGYQINRAAQITRSGRSNTILHLNSGGNSELSGRVSYQVGRLVHEAGFDFQSVDSYWWPEEGEKIIRQILALNPEGVIVSGSAQSAIDFSHLFKAGIPVVGLGYPIPNAPWVRHDPRSAIAELTRGCLEKGRSPVALFQRGANWTQFERHLGFMDALAGVKEVPKMEIDRLPPSWKANEPVILYSNFNNPTQLNPFDPGIHAARQLLAKNFLPDALICSNDHYAFGVLSVFYRAGITVPDAMFLTGFDDLSFSPHGVASLTTVSQPIQEMCATAVDVLKNLIIRPETRGHSGKATEIILPCQIIWRESTGTSKRSSPSLEVAA